MLFILFTELFIKYNARQALIVIAMQSLMFSNYTLCLTKKSQAGNPLGAHFWTPEGTESN